MSFSKSLANFCQEAPDKFMNNYHVTLKSANPPSYHTPTGLSKEIWDFVEKNKQTLDEFTKKMDLWKRLNDHLKMTYPNYGIFVVGSTLSGFGLKCSDTDFTFLASKMLCTNKMTAQSSLRQLVSDIGRYSYASKIEFIDATCPLIKFEDRLSNLEVDITYCQTANIRNTHLLYQYSQVDWRVKPLMIVIKVWAKIHGVVDPRYGTLSSYAMMLMVIYFLQCGTKPAVLPCLQKTFKEKFANEQDLTNIDFFEKLEITAAGFHSYNQQSLSELLLEFFKFYDEFDFENYVMSVREGTKYPKSMYPVQYQDRLSYKSFILIEEPFTLKNVACTVFRSPNFQKIKPAFREAYLKLKATNHLQSIL